MGSKRKHSPEFFKGVSEAKMGSEYSTLNRLYNRAKEMSAEGTSLPEVEKGYVFGVANKLLNHKGRALDAAEFYSVIGELNGAEFKDKVADALVKDARATKDYDYVRQIQSFLESNKMKKYSTRLSLEANLKSSRKREWILSSIFFVLAGVFSSFSLTGNVIGSVDSGFGFFGAGFFVLGIVSFLIGRKS